MTTSKADKHFNDIMVVSDNQSKADKLMNEFLYIIKDDPDFSCISRVRHSIYFKGDLGRVMFIGYRVKDRMLQGFRGRDVTERTFRRYMDNFVSIKESIHEI